jgi:hypothetical protein
MESYKNIYYTLNPFNDLDIEPKYLIYTPDIETYADTIKEIRKTIDKWLVKNGSLEIYRFKRDMKIGINRLSIV